MSGPVGLMDASFDALEIMRKAGVGGVQLLEQGHGWCTWALSKDEHLPIAARALIEAGWTTVDMRIEDGSMAIYASY